VGYKVIFAPQAIERLQQIVSHIARDHPDAALRFGMRLVDHAELLADFPELGAPYRKRPGVRRLACKPYFIYYRVQHEKRLVEIMDYWHSAQREPEM
jgi:plasmid stabilization system protein ParE